MAEKNDSNLLLFSLLLFILPMSQLSRGKSKCQNNLKSKQEGTAQLFEELLEQYQIPVTFPFNRIAINKIIFPL